jgi:hypothetical protein
MDTFVDPDQGDVLTFSAHGEGSDVLPSWLHFDPETLGFSGTAPAGDWTGSRIVVRATDFDGAWAEGQLLLERGAPGSRG